MQRTCPLKLIKLKIKTFHFLQGSRSQSFTFLAKVTIEEVFYVGQPPSSKQTCRTTTGLERETQTELRREEPGACVFYHAKAAFFLSQQKFKAEQSFSMGLFVGLSDRPGSKEAERRHRSEATKLSGARMPEQRRAGQLVCHKTVPMVGHSCPERDLQTSPFSKTP